MVESGAKVNHKAFTQYDFKNMVNTSKYPSNPQETPQPGHPGVTFRAILLGIILIPPNSYFIMANHLRYWSTLPTTMSLILQRSGDVGGVNVS